MLQTSLKLLLSNVIIPVTPHLWWEHFRDENIDDADIILTLTYQNNYIPSSVICQKVTDTWCKKICHLIKQISVEFRSNNYWESDCHPGNVIAASFWSVINLCTWFNPEKNVWVAKKCLIQKHDNRSIIWIKSDSSIPKYSALQSCSSFCYFYLNSLPPGF